MASDEDLARLRQGVAAWNDWRAQNPEHHVDLRRADLKDTKLPGANLSWVDLRGADLSPASLDGADLRRADLQAADLSGATLLDAQLVKANLRKAKLLVTNFEGAALDGVDLYDADLSGSSLRAARITQSNLGKANLQKADLTISVWVESNLAGANLTGCSIYGMSAWNLNLHGTEQRNLVITRRDEPEITVDNIEVGQFIYLLLHNDKIRGVIDTITSKVVLILGRFTLERKLVLDALREELRKHDYLPILFDFPETESRDLTETISLLARMARFICRSHQS